MTILRVCLLGALVVSWDGIAPPPTAGTAARSLFACLLICRARPHTRELLAGTFRPDRPGQAMWRIRKTLDPHPALPATGDTVQPNPALPLWILDQENAWSKIDGNNAKPPPAWFNRRAVGTSWITSTKSSDPAGKDGSPLIAPQCCNIEVSKRTQRRREKNHGEQVRSLCLVGSGDPAAELRGGGGPV